MGSKVIDMRNESSLLIGAIGDDMTGSTDLALMLGKHGLSVVQYIGVPSGDMKVENAHAAIIGLKTRTLSVDIAIEQSLSAYSWLNQNGAKQFFFKYCSTFDSTETGNIGPVTENLMNIMGEGITVVCPAFPENGRTVYHGHLFVGQDLLSDSGMRHHPLTPMKDANLVRFLGKQVSRPQEVGLVSFKDVNGGPQVIKKKLNTLKRMGIRFAVVDTLTNQHLFDLAKACSDLRLITGGSGIAMGLPGNFQSAGLLSEQGGLESLPALSGNALVIAGSCSEATQKQVAKMSKRYPSLQLNPSALIIGHQSVDNTIDWIKQQISSNSVLIYSTAAPEQVTEVQSKYGIEKTGEMLEGAFAQIALEMLGSGISKFIIAGGETSGAVVKALGIKALRIGPEIAPGVPWTFTATDPVVCLALKSGNFGEEAFFDTALEVLA